MVQIGRGDCERKSEFFLKELGKEEVKQKNMLLVIILKVFFILEFNKNYFKLGLLVFNKIEEIGKLQFFFSYQQQFQVDSFKVKQMENYQFIKEVVEMKFVMDFMKQIGVDLILRFK